MIPLNSDSPLAAGNHIVRSGAKRASAQAAVRAAAFAFASGLGLVSAIVAVTVHAAEGDTVTVALPKVVPSEFNGDLRQAPLMPLGQMQLADRPYRPLLRPPTAVKSESPAAIAEKDSPVTRKAAMPGPLQNFEGIARLDSCTGGQCGDGTPPDTNGEVGPNHYVQAVNSAYGIYNKSGALLASFTENQLWAGDASICNGESFGDPIVVYDALADRWILTHFAFALSGNNTVQPYFQCIAVSKTADPVAGGWWLYPVRTDDASHPWLNDYSKFGIWTDCLYMSANEFTGAGAFAGTLFASFSRADMYAGLPLTGSIGYITNTATPFSMVPSHLGGQTGANVPAGTPNYFVSESQTLFRFEVRKFTAGPNCGAGGTLGAATLVTQTSYTFAGGAVAPQPGTTVKLDVIDDRVMQKVQYRNIGGQESLWVAHTYRTSSSGVTGIQWAQINVTGGTVSTTALQQQKYSPDTTLYRFMPSLAVDTQGNMALGYSLSNGTAPNYPSIAYSGRLAGDTANTLPQTETVLIAGGGAQTGSCGGAPCDRWGDYSAMSVDPADDCTFWMTNEYYPGPPDANTIAWHTRIGSFKFPGCTGSSRTADLAITKTDGSLTAVPGAPITYTIVVINNGPFAVSGATVTDMIPAAITGVTWTCAASAGNSCPASGTGSISTSAVNLMKGGTATFTVQGTVSPSGSGSLSNTATVAVPAGFTDPVSGNNSATDTDTVGAALSPPDVAKGFGTSPIVVGQTSLLTITITNPNAGAALGGVAFTDSLPAGVSAPNASGAGCGGTVTVNANVISLTGGTLAAGGNCSVPVSVTGAQAQVAPWTNTISSVSSTEGGTNSTPATANIIVNKAATSTAIVSDLPDPSVVGQAYTVTYSISAPAPGAGTPTGTVTVSDGTSNCTGTLPAASCQLTSLSTGAKTLTATYNGDTNFNSSSAPTAPHQVNPSPTTTTIVSDTPDPSVVGQPFTVTYSVAAAAPGAGTPTGTVTVTDGSANCTGTLPATSCQLTSTTTGAKSLTATYIGSANFSGSASATAAHQVNKAATATAIVSDLPDPTVVSQPYTVTYSVTVSAPGAGTPTGTVTISDGTDSCTGTLPATSCQLTSTTVGAKTLAATYNGDTNFNSSSAPTASHQVNPSPTTTAIVSDTPDPSVVGQPFTVTYSVAAAAPGAGTPTGTVTVTDGSANCTGTLPAISCQLASTTAGAKSLTATYNGSANFNGSISATAAHQVNKAATATAIVSDLPDPSVVGEAYTVTYAVAVSAPGAGTPGGTVTVSDGTANCIGTLPATSCQLTSSTAGAKSLSATYNGDANFNSSVSAVASHQVDKGATTIAIVSDLPDPTVVGQPYTVTYSMAVTAPAVGTPGGTVAVSDGAASCIATLPATSCQLTSTSIGAKSLVATYNGDANFNSSVSASIAHQVNQAATSTAIVSDVPDPSVVGQAYTVTYSISVTAPGSGTPGGTVTVSDGTASCIGTLPATNCQLTSATTGAKSLTATYNGDANFNSSVSAAAAHQVNKGTTSTAIISGLPDPTVVGQPYTVTYGVTVSAPGAGTPTGTVTISDGTDSCTGTLPATSCQLISTTAGAKTLTATYNGDTNFSSSVSATAAHQVNKGATTIAIVSDLPDPTVVGQPYTVTFSVSVAAPGSGTPSGTVTVSDGSGNCIGTLPATSCQLTSVTAGAKSLTATYNGDANFNSSVSVSAAHQVNQAATTTTIVSDTPAPSVVGTAVAVTASVAPVPPGGGGSPTGSIAISDGVDGCTITLPATSCNWTPTTVGTRMLVATYGGDANFGGSESAAKSHVVASTQGAVTINKTGSGSGQVASDDNNIACGGACVHAYANGTLVTLTATPDPGSIFTGWLGPCTGTATCSFTVNGDATVSATFALDTIGNRTLDVDDNNAYDAATDGLLIARYLFGLTGSAVTSGATGGGANRQDPADVLQYLEDIRPQLDIDGNGQVDPLTDGLLIIRYLFGLRGAALMQGALASGATRTTSMQLEDYLQSLVP